MRCPLATVGMLGLLGCAGKQGGSQKAATAPHGTTGDTSGDSGDTADSGDSGDVEPPPDLEPARGEYNSFTPKITLDDRIWELGILGDIDGDGVDEVVANFLRQGGVSIVTANLYDGSSPIVRYVGASAGRGYALGFGGQMALRDGDTSQTWFFDGLPQDGAELADASAGPLEGVRSLWPVGDLDGDGLTDFGVTAAEDGPVVVFRGPIPPGAVSWGDAWCSIDGLSQVNAVADVDGDGSTDLVVLDRLANDTQVVFGPFAAGVNSAADLPQAHLSSAWPWDNPSVVSARSAPQSAVFVVTYDGVAVYRDVLPAQTRTTPDAVLDSNGYGGWTVLGADAAYDGDADGVLGVAMFGQSTADDASFGGFYDLPSESTGVETVDVVLHIVNKCAGAATLGGPAHGDVVCASDRMLDLFRGFEHSSGHDGDRDGWQAPDDCDDWDASRHPSAAETSDGRDEDCDGVVDEELSRFSRITTAPTLVGESGNWLGRVMTTADGDGDGLDEVVVGVERGNSGAVALWVTPAHSGLADAIASRTGNAGWATIFGAGDCDGDGDDEVIIDASEDAWLLVGPFTGTSAMDADPSAAHVDLAVTPRSAFFAPAGDADGDGREDIAAGTAAIDYEVSDVGEVVIVSGPALVAGETLPIATFTKPDTRRWLLAAAIGDVNDDGYDDLSLGDEIGTVIFTGPLLGEYDVADAPLQYENGSTSAVTADTDGDGARELWLSLGEYGVLTAFAAPPASGSFARTDMLAEVTEDDPASENYKDQFCAAWVVADFDNDGRDTLVCGSPYASGGALGGGRVYAFEGGVTGTVSAGSIAAWMLDGTAPSENAGWTLSALHLGPTTELAVGLPGYIAGLGEEGALATTAVP